MTVPPPAAEIPNLVDPGWYRCEVVHAETPAIKLFWWAPTRIGFAHLCDRGPRGTIWCAPLLTDVNQPGGHQVSGSLGKTTVTASILCPDCGLHGFVTEGRWTDA